MSRVAIAATVVGATALVGGGLVWLARSQTAAVKTYPGYQVVPNIFIPELD